MADENKTQTPTREQFSNIAKQYHDAKSDAEADKIIEANEAVIKLANKADRKLARVGLPMSVRLDQRTDEIPFLAGAKNFVKYVGSASGLGALGWLGYKAWRG